MDANFVVFYCYKFDGLLVKKSVYSNLDKKLAVKFYNEHKGKFLDGDDWLVIESKLF